MRAGTLYGGAGDFCLNIAVRFGTVDCVVRPIVTVIEWAARQSLAISSPERDPCRTHSSGDSDLYSVGAYAVNATSDFLSDPATNNGIAGLMSRKLCVPCFLIRSGPISRCRGDT